MDENALGPFPEIKRFRLDELREENGRASVLLILEALDKSGDVKRIEATLTPEEAIRNGNALVGIGTALKAVRH